jgi:hypothetical protein
MTLAASPTQLRHAMARQDVAADALVVAEVGTRKEYRAPLWQASSRKRVLIVGPCEFSQIRSSWGDAFFAAVTADPLFTWLPDWAIFDHYGERSGNQPISEDVGAELRRLIGGAPVPAGAIQAATDVAAALGWSRDSAAILLKRLETTDGAIGARVAIIAYSDYSVLLLDYWMWGQTP